MKRAPPKKSIIDYFNPKKSRDSEASGINEQCVCFEFTRPIQCLAPKSEFLVDITIKFILGLQAQELSSNIIPSVLDSSVPSTSTGHRPDSTITTADIESDSEDVDIVCEYFQLC